VELTSVRTVEKVLPPIVLIRVLEEEETGCEDEGEGLEDFEGGSEEEEGWEVAGLVGVEVVLSVGSLVPTEVVDGAWAPVVEGVEEEDGGAAVVEEVGTADQVALGSMV